ncbi:hypothetical protein [Austwickia chelonae]|uniref:hypothetical protein n=1 Tax=Austwickia chelonae TaxID=100225 RepID=UPI003D318560
MLDVTRQKVDQEDLAGRVELIEADMIGYLPKPLTLTLRQGQVRGPSPAARRRLAP